MANLSRPFGFRPTRYTNSASYNGASNLYAFSISDTTATFVGDVVKIDTTNRSTALADVYSPGIPLVAQAGSTLTTSVYRGIVVGFLPEPEFSQSGRASLGLYYRLASSTRYVFVVDDIDVVFEVQESGTNSYTTAANNGINKLIDVSAGAGVTSTGISTYTVVGSTVATTNKPFRILRLSQRPDNWLSLASDTTPNWHWDVLMANCDLWSGNMTGA